MMPGMDGTDDVLQETNIVLWEKRESFEPGTNFRAWASSIARLKTLEHRRKIFKLGYRQFNEELSEQLAVECESELGEMDQHLRTLDKCLEHLGDKERQLVEHRYHSKSPLDDFARQSGRPVESLRVSLFRIRAALKKCIEGELAIKRILS
jgi:RNA polymerase sigma-70 factor (ECF subfamily)